MNKTIKFTFENFDTEQTVTWEIPVSDKMYKDRSSDIGRAKLKVIGGAYAELLCETTGGDWILSNF